MITTSSTSTIVSPARDVAQSGRLLSVDVLRGITIAFMILVNNNGNEAVAYWPLKHSAWNGCTPTDLVFPTFLFLVGIAIVFSTASRISRGETKRVLVMHAFRRAVIIFVISLIVHGFPNYPLATMRVYGVLQRIAVCYLVATLLYLWDRRVVTLLSTIPALATCLFGVLTGLWLRTEKRMMTKVGGMLAASIGGLALGSFWG